MITFNQEKYIAQAIESVLVQITKFDYELVIGEDCSTDKTRKIVIDYQKKYPNKIRLILNRHNIGANLNFDNAFMACKGKYIAILEGDDYWTLPSKLQKQVDFLENNPEYAISAHAVDIISQSNKESFVPDTIKKNPKKEYTMRDLIHENFIPTCSVVYRKINGLILPSWMKHVSYQDLPLHILHAQYGKISYFPEVMACYRVHSGGMWANRDKLFKIKRTITIYKHLNRYFKYQSKDVKRELFNKYFHLATIYKNINDGRNAKKYALASLQYSNIVQKLQVLRLFV